MLQPLIMNADDFGLSEETNTAIVRAHQRGVLTSASLLVTCPGLEHALRQAIPACPNLGLGMHLSLTTGKSILSPREIPDLVDGHGFFKNGFLAILCRCLRQDENFMDQIEREFRAQLEMALGLDVNLDHMNGERHIHMIPGIFKIVSSLAREFNIHWIRVSHEPYCQTGNMAIDFKPFVNGNILKKILLSCLAGQCRNSARTHGISFPAHYFGVLHTWDFPQAALRSILSRHFHGPVEIAFHPACRPPPHAHSWNLQDMKSFMAHPGRGRELELLTDPSVREFIAQHGYRLVNYSQCG